MLFEAPFEQAFSWQLVATHLACQRGPTGEGFVKRVQTAMQSFAEQHILAADTMEAWSRPATMEDVSHASGLVSASSCCPITSCLMHTVSHEAPLKLVAVTLRTGQDAQLHRQRSLHNDPPAGHGN